MWPVPVDTRSYRTSSRYIMVKRQRAIVKSEVGNASRLALDYHFTEKERRRGKGKRIICVLETCRAFFFALGTLEGERGGRWGLTFGRCSS